MRTAPPARAVPRTPRKPGRLGGVGVRILATTRRCRCRCGAPGVEWGGLLGSDRRLSAKGEWFVGVRRVGAKLSVDRPTGVTPRRRRRTHFSIRLRAGLEPAPFGGAAVCCADERPAWTSVSWGRGEVGIALRAWPPHPRRGTPSSRWPDGRGLSPGPLASRVASVGLVVGSWRQQSVGGVVAVLREWSGGLARL